MFIGQPPASLTSQHCIIQPACPPIGWTQTMRYSCGWWPRKRHTACEFPCCFQFYTQQWWEMNLPWLSLKGSSVQSKSQFAIGQVYVTIPCVITLRWLLWTAECMLCWLWMSNSKLENKNKIVVVLWGNMCTHDIKKHNIYLNNVQSISLLVPKQCINLTLIMLMIT